MYDKVGDEISETGHLLQILFRLRQVTACFVKYKIQRTHLSQLQAVPEERHHCDELDGHCFEYCQWTDRPANIHYPPLQQKQWFCHSQGLWGLRTNHVFEDPQQFCSGK